MEEAAFGEVAAGKGNKTDFDNPHLFNTTLHAESN
jgi:hypothetical protein